MSAQRNPSHSLKPEPTTELSVLRQRAVFVPCSLVVSRDGPWAIICIGRNMLDQQQYRIRYGDSWRSDTYSSRAAVDYAYAKMRGVRLPA
jgi:hypothetical protein